MRHNNINVTCRARIVIVNTQVCRYVYANIYLSPRKQAGVFTTYRRASNEIFFIVASGTYRLIENIDFSWPARAEGVISLVSYSNIFLYSSIKVGRCVSAGRDGVYITGRDAVNARTIRWSFLTKGKHGL
ncbi:hypothetical protein RRG08_032649 [Elysia crispata]|uniref:Uncharacterized protein n=1 Tax=Elysia crispata TaxID=231223 RepID=A0AAE0Y0Q2_9GAST|nr:hypothetical protein RRG08_032649 [Elysia crispata]